MTDEELLKKDWQLLTAKTLISNASFLRTILENQNFIISKLCNMPISDVTAKTNEYLAENYQKVVKMIDTGIPDYPVEGRKFV